MEVKVRLSKCRRLRPICRSTKCRHKRWRQNKMSRTIRFFLLNVETGVDRCRHDLMLCCCCCWFVLPLKLTVVVYLVWTPSWVLFLSVITLFFRWKFDNVTTNVCLSRVLAQLNVTWICVTWFIWISLSSSRISLLENEWRKRRGEGGGIFDGRIWSRAPAAYQWSRVWTGTMWCGPQMSRSKQREKKKLLRQKYKMLAATLLVGRLVETTDYTFIGECVCKWYIWTVCVCACERERGSFLRPREPTAL